MPKIVPAFSGIERPNECSDTPVQSFDCALGSLAQASLQGMERQLDRVEVGRILRQEFEACANTPESLLDTGDSTMVTAGISDSLRRLAASTRPQPATTRSAVSTMIGS